MIKVNVYENAIELTGHAARGENGDRSCCAAVSAAVQTALAFLDIVGYDRDDIVSPYSDHGGHMVIFTDKIYGWEKIMLTALLNVLADQAEAWPGKIVIESSDDPYEPED